MDAIAWRRTWRVGFLWRKVGYDWMVIGVDWRVGREAD
jgi:hypothetical protein